MEVYEEETNRLRTAGLAVLVLAFISIFFSWSTYVGLAAAGLGLGGSILLMSLLNQANLGRLPLNAIIVRLQQIYYLHVATACVSGVSMVVNMISGFVHIANSIYFSSGYVRFGVIAVVCAFLQGAMMIAAIIASTAEYRRLSLLRSQMTQAMPMFVGALPAAYPVAQPQQVVMASQAMPMMMMVAPPPQHHI